MLKESICTDTGECLYLLIFLAMRVLKHVVHESFKREWYENMCATFTSAKGTSGHMRNEGKNHSSHKNCRIKFKSIGTSALITFTKYMSGVGCVGVEKYIFCLAFSMSTTFYTKLLSWGFIGFFEN